LLSQADQWLISFAFHEFHRYRNGKEPEELGICCDVFISTTKSQQGMSNQIKIESGCDRRFISQNKRKNVRTFSATPKLSLFLSFLPSFLLLYCSLDLYRYVKAALWLMISGFATKVMYVDAVVASLL
jgi:hypothetical protein